MAIDPASKGSPRKVTPAREHAPAGTVNISRPESGGQEYSCGGPAATPSMNRRPHSPRTTGQPRPDGGLGGAVSD